MSSFPLVDLHQRIYPVRKMIFDSLTRSRPASATVPQLRDASLPPELMAGVSCVLPSRRMNPPGNILVDLSRAIGPMLLSIFISTALWGVMCVQAVIYFAKYKSDTWHLKSLIIALLVLETFHETICIQGLSHFLIPEFGDILHMSAVDKIFSLEPLVTGIVAALAQGFFTWRIWRFSNRNKTLPIILCPFIIVNFVGFMIVSKINLDSSIGSMNSRLLNLVLGFGSVVATTDVFIAVAMCFLLWNRRTGIIAFDRIIVRLISASMSTGASMAVFALISVITGAIWPHDLFYVLGEVPLCAIYGNAVLANLNSRRYIRDENFMNVSTNLNTKSSGSSLKMSTLDVAVPQRHGGRGDITVEQARDEERHAQARFAQF